MALGGRFIAVMQDQARIVTQVLNRRIQIQLGKVNNLWRAP